MMKSPIKREATLRVASTPSQPGKSGTKKADEIYHFLSFSSFLIVLLRIFRESDYKSLPPYSLYVSVAVLIMGGAMGLTVEASDYNYLGARQNQSWDTRSSPDYATRWDRGTKPWVREPSGAARPGFDAGASSNYGAQGATDVNSMGRRDWPQTGRGVPRSDDPWYSSDKRHHASPRDERPMETRRDSEQWTSVDERRNSWSGTGNWPKSDPSLESRASSEYRNDWSADTSWSRGAKSGNSTGAYRGSEPKSRDWSRSSTSVSPNDYGRRSPATQNRWANDPWRGSGSYAPAPDTSRHQKHWGRDWESREGDKPWGARSHANSRFEQRSSPTGNMQDMPPSNGMRPEYPGYYSYPEQYHGVLGDGFGYGLGGYGYYPGYHRGWGGGSYLEPNLPMPNDSSWFLF
uniref:Uncharacterized protein n=1 Tax=Candidatus Kentrum sp. UNK TaxID=2126344 RepID=A0A451AW61_9GAMM|nr:MAG: hypothetical protein BECKUNK1418G_GA0071005_102215 [Candidatus Kentron sp. UNK]VFK70290.1 MAG: hypothetical protein BECKUNK1418H_GA0071006_102613 [Candidatus Kentron sp. UNK]